MKHSFLKIHNYFFSNKGAKRINKMGKDIYIDDFEAELLVSDTSFKPPKDKEEDDNLNVKQVYHRYSGKLSIIDRESVQKGL